MTGQVKEQILTRFGELGVEVEDGRVRFAPRLVPRAELYSDASTAVFRSVEGRQESIDLAPDSLAFSYCQVPVIYGLGETATIEVEYAGGRRKAVAGDRLDRDDSLAILRRRGTIRRLTVTVAADSLYG